MVDIHQGLGEDPCPLKQLVTCIVISSTDAALKRSSAETSSPRSRAFSPMRNIGRIFQIDLFSGAKHLKTCYRRRLLCSMLFYHSLRLDAKLRITYPTCPKIFSLCKIYVYISRHLQSKNILSVPFCHWMKKGSHRPSECLESFLATLNHTAWKS